jgi:acetyl/propionyl-CoA carboxylase alpha subunit
MKKLLIANRGEIARRILKAGKQRGYTVAVIATPDDLDSLVCQEADAVLEVSSFLNANDIVNKALQWKADAIHPGYGFLSENSQFAFLVEKSGIVFVGPTVSNMQALGSKEAAKKLAQQCGVPTLTALLSHDLQSIPQSRWEQELKQRDIIAPFLIKASGGGGGRGMRIVEHASELPNAIKRASEEAKSAFNDGTVFVERYLSSPKHIEIQVFGDGKGGGVYFGERECSMQRRHQKVIEEAPSASISLQQREEMGKASLALVKQTQYRGAGTIEFLMDFAGQFYFLEMNTRLQVEHPVTELVYGVDLVDAQLQLAEGNWPLNFPDANTFYTFTPRCVALEARILAEDPSHDFLPTPGLIKIYEEPREDDVRVDTGVLSGARVNPNFDSMIAKLIVSGENRALAIEKLIAALKHFEILGCITNLSFLQHIAEHKDFLEGKHATNWIAAQLPQLIKPKLPDFLLNVFESHKFREKISLLLDGFFEATELATINNVFAMQSDKLKAYSKLYEASNNTINFKIHKTKKHNKFFLESIDIFNFFQNKYIESENVTKNMEKYFINSMFDKNYKIPFSAIRLSQQYIQINICGEYLKLECPFYIVGKNHKNSLDSGEIRAPMAGKVFEVLVHEGQEVFSGQVLFVVESMKMQLEVKSAGEGLVVKVFVEQGQILSGSDVMAMIELKT